MIAVGKISKSIGLKGEVRVTLLTDSPGRFRTLKSVWIGSEEGTAMRFKIQSVRVSPAAVVMQVEKVQTRTAADALRGQFVFVADKDQVKPKKGSYFIHEIVGMMVVDEAGAEIGTVEEVMQLPAHDVWVVTSGEMEFLIPAIKEVIRSVDIGRKTVVIRPMEGMLD
ncbi:MAG TPA: 16S rRNA processing protein RimM [Bacteroidetes bacterium]|nr:16S rRNA processing protein RimM [Bacteroidota bacterium]